MAARSLVFLLAAGFSLCSGAAFAQAPDDAPNALAPNPRPLQPPPGNLPPIGQPPAGQLPGSLPGSPTPAAGTPRSPSDQPMSQRLTIPYTEEELRAATLQIRNRLPDTDTSDGLLPPDAAKIVFDAEPRPYVQQRNWAATDYQWQASDMWHYPLLFEDVMLERHGHARAHWAQPFVSGGRMIVGLAASSYNCTLDPPRTRISTLGHYRPGSYVPPMRQRPRWRWDAAGVQAAATTGLIFIVP